MILSANVIFHELDVLHDDQSREYNLYKRYPTFTDLDITTMLFTPMHLDISMCHDTSHTYIDNIDTHVNDVHTHIKKLGLS